MPAADFHALGESAGSNVCRAFGLVSARTCARLLWPGDEHGALAQLEPPMSHSTGHHGLPLGRFQGNPQSPFGNQRLFQRELGRAQPCRGAFWGLQAAASVS